MISRRKKFTTTTVLFKMTSNVTTFNICSEIMELYKYKSPLPNDYPNQFCHVWSRNWLPFRSTWVHLRFFVLLDRYNYILCNILLIIACPFRCGHFVVCPSSIYGFWLPLWHLQTLFVSIWLYAPTDEDHNGKKLTFRRTKDW